MRRWLVRKHYKNERKRYLAIRCVLLNLILDLVKNRRQRRRCGMEIVKTEQKYVQSLQIIVDVSFPSSGVITAI